MSIAERIQNLINCTDNIPEKDNAGIITAAGIDYTVRMKALKECLKIVKDEENNNECN